MWRDPTKMKILINYQQNHEYILVKKISNLFLF